MTETLNDISVDINNKIFKKLSTISVDNAVVIHRIKHFIYLSGYSKAYPPHLGVFFIPYLFHT